MQASTDLMQICDSSHRGQSKQVTEQNASKSGNSEGSGCNEKEKNREKVGQQ